MIKISSMMDLRYPFKKQCVENNMMMQMLQYKILKSNHLLSDELFQKKNIYELRVIENHMPLWNVLKKGKCYCWLMVRLQKTNKKSVAQTQILQAPFFFSPRVIISTLQFSCRGVVCWLKWRENCALDKELGCSFFWETLNQWGMGLLGQIGSHKLWHSWWFWIPPSSHTPRPTNREFHALRVIQTLPMFGSFSGHWKSMFPTNLADIFVLILSHSVQQMKKLNMSIDQASHIVFCLLQIFLGTWDSRIWVFKLWFAWSPFNILFFSFPVAIWIGMGNFFLNNNNNNLFLLVGCNECMHTPKSFLWQFFKSRKT
jgi:hypothetical protein